MSIARIAVLTGFISVAANAAAPPDPALQAEIESLAAKLTDGYATLDHADTYVGAEGTPSFGRVIVLMTMISWGGGNGARQYMAALGYNDTSVKFSDGRPVDKYRLLGLVQVGSDYDRGFKNVELRDDRIILTGGRWMKGDAHCCPSGDARAVYRISEHGLNEVTR